MNEPPQILNTPLERSQKVEELTDETTIEIGGRIIEAPYAVWVSEQGYSSAQREDDDHMTAIIIVLPIVIFVVIAIIGFLVNLG